MLGKVSQGSMNDILDKGKSYYYQWLPCLMRELQPKQVVELGGAMGASSLMMLYGLPKSSKLYSITLEEHGLEFSFMEPELYPNFTQIVGNDLDLMVWPENLDLGETDIWFFDTDHTYEQLMAEYELYKPFFKPGAVLLFDDIKLNDGMKKAWKEMELGDKYEADELHWSGFGVAIYG